MLDNVLVANVFTGKKSSVKEGTSTGREGKSGNGDKRISHSLDEGGRGGTPHDDFIRTKKVRAKGGAPNGIKS